ncbi:MAG: uncharacterized protein A8A55_2393 [Amphiamblys sp. WSBS2006]|nr:MAG: uncharacterized protein A8A55_2393 [Amphiamblys sp. WSBS2006]
MQRRTEKTKSTLRKNARDTERMFLFHARNRLCRGLSVAPRWTRAGRSRENTRRGKTGLGSPKTHAMGRDEYRTQPGLSRRTFEDGFLALPQIGFFVFQKPLLATCSERST